MKEMKTTVPHAQERALLVGVMVHGRNDQQEACDTLEELAQLTESAGAEVLGRMLCKQSKVHAAHFIGKGKVVDS